MLCEPSLPVLALGKNEPLIRFLEVTQPEANWVEEFRDRNSSFFGTRPVKRNSSQTKATSSISMEGLANLAGGPSMFTRVATAVAQLGSPADSGGIHSLETSPEDVNNQERNELPVLRPRSGRMGSANTGGDYGHEAALSFTDPFDDISQVDPQELHQGHRNKANGQASVLKSMIGDLSKLHEEQAKQAGSIEELNHGLGDLSDEIGTVPKGYEGLSVWEALGSATRAQTKKIMREVTKLEATTQGIIDQEVARQTKELTSSVEELTRRFGQLSQAFKASTKRLGTRMTATEEAVEAGQFGPSIGSSGLDQETREDLRHLKDVVADLMADAPILDPNSIVNLEERMSGVELESQAISLRVAGNSTYEFGGDY